MYMNMCHLKLRSAVTGVMAVLACGYLLTACQMLRSTSGDEDFDYRTIAYVRGQTQIWTVSADKLTHINYAFAHVNDSGEVYLRDEDSPGHLAQIQALKARNPDLKILVSVGGWGADGFSDAALNDSTRARFSRSAVEFVKMYGLDGFDVDWEYPGQAGPGIKFREEDKQNFTLMLKSLREHLDALSDERGRTGDDRYLLTIASATSEQYFDHTEMDLLHPYLDFVNVMTYDMYGSWSNTTGHHTGLYETAGTDMTIPSSVDAVERHLEAGIPPRKIVLGVAFYGRGWSGVDSANGGILQPYERYVGSWGYDHIRRTFNSSAGFTRHWDDVAKAPYLWNPDSTMFISYDDPESLRHKAEYVRASGLGGIMYWEHSHDPNEVLLDAIYTNISRRRTR